VQVGDRGEKKTANAASRPTTIKDWTRSTMRGPKRIAAPPLREANTLLQTADASFPTKIAAA
jgi:hypothetical protein